MREKVKFNLRHILLSCYFLNMGVSFCFYQFFFMFLIIVLYCDALCYVLSFDFILYCITLC